MFVNVVAAQKRPSTAGNQSAVPTLKLMVGAAPSQFLQATIASLGESETRIDDESLDGSWVGYVGESQLAHGPVERSWPSSPGASFDTENTGEQHNMVDYGVIGDEWRASKGHAAEAEKAQTDCPLTESCTKKRHPQFEFKGIRKLNIRESEQTLNVMCVGESGMGKSTLIDSFFKTFREQGEVDQREESSRVLELRQELTRQENLLREAQKEKQRLADEDMLMEAEEVRKKIVDLEAGIDAINAEIERQRSEDQESNAHLEKLKREIHELKKQKDDAKREDRLTDAQMLKEQLGQKEQEKKDLEGKKRPLPTSNPGPSPTLINEPTVEVRTMPPFYIKHTVADQPPVNLKVTLIDTPGYGDNTNLETTFKKIVAYIEEQFVAHRKKAEEAKRGASESFGKDPLVHCVLYFIAPHRLKPVDIDFMKELHAKVNIIPIIAKSDTMMTDEKAAFKMKVRDELEKQGINVFEFHRASIEEMSRQAKIKIEHPWAVIATKDAKIDDDGQVIALRKYDWGDADAANPSHSDLLALQTLILGEAEAWKDLKKQTDQKYESWREETMAEEQTAAAQPMYKKARSQLLSWYSSIPPMYTMSFILLLLVIGITPMAVELGKRSIRAHTASETSKLSSELTSTAGKLETYKLASDQLQAQASTLEENLANMKRELDEREAAQESLRRERDELRGDKKELQEAVRDKTQLLQKERQATWQCEKDLQKVSGQYASFERGDAVTELKRKIREWHKNSKAWYLEALPKEFDE